MELPVKREDSSHSPTHMWRVDVHSTKKGIDRLSWGDRSISILEIVDEWSELGRWWQGEKPAELRKVFTPKGMFLLWRERDGKDWYAKPVH